MPLPASLRLSSVASPTMWNFRASPVCASDSFFHLRSYRMRHSVGSMTAISRPRM
jgi:hypothetical protein